MSQHYQQQQGDPRGCSQFNSQYQVPYNNYNTTTGQPPPIGHQLPRPSQHGQAQSLPYGHDHSSNIPNNFTQGTSPQSYPYTQSGHAQTSNTSASHQSPHWANHPPSASSYSPGHIAASSAYTPALTSMEYLNSSVSAYTNYSAPYNHHVTSQPQYPPSPNPNYLHPTASVPNQYSQHQCQQAVIYSGATTTIYPQGSPAIQPINHAHPPPRHAVPQPSALPNLDISKLSLTQKNNAMLPLHWLTCDGCGASPLRVDRWRCISCTDYDLCEACHDNNIHSHHQFEMIHFRCETHDCYCDGCQGEIKDRLLVGLRYICLTHHDEDWFERCVNAGKACTGPFKIERQTELGLQLERDSCLPMPQRLDTRFEASSRDLQY